MKDLFSLEGRVAVVTGAARGNGEAIARALLGAGATVYFLDLNEAQISVLKRHLKVRRARFEAVDVTDFNSVENLFARIYARERRFDILVNNAGITLPAPSEAYSVKAWEETHSVNVTAPFRLSQLAFPYMKRTGSGSIINLTSLNAEVGGSNNPAYCSSKGGLKLLTKSLALDWGKHGIRVNNLGLGYFRTRMTAKSWANTVTRKQRAERTILGRWGEAADLAGPAVFLASDASLYMTGQDLYIDGGWLAKGI